MKTKTDVELLRELSNTTTEGFDIGALDRVYNEVLFPYLKSRAVRLKTDKVDLRENLSLHNAYKLMKELFNNKFTIQRLVETEMMPYLQAKGYKVYTYDPSYFVAISWHEFKNK